MINKKLLKYISIQTVIFMFIAHGFCYLNILYSHDSLNIFHSAYYGDSLAIGRFLIPVWNYIRGPYYPPLLIGVLSVIFFIIINYLIVKLFCIKDKKLITLICGMLTTYTSITLLNATYINYSDMYIFCILLNVIAVYLMRERKFTPLAIVCLFITYGIYQSYLGVTLGLLIILLIKDLFEKEKPMVIIKKGIMYIICILTSLCIYYVSLKVIPYFTNIPLENKYNSVSNVGYKNLKEIFKTIKNTYNNFGETVVIKNTVHKTIISKICILLIIIFIIEYVKYFINSKLDKKQNALIILLTLFLPFAINIIYFITKGTIHGLMTYPLVIFYIFMLFILLNNKNELFKKFVFMSFCLIIFSNIIFANQVYEKKKLEIDSTIITLNRVIDRIEALDGYTPAYTPIVIVGDLNRGPLAVKKDGFDYEQVGLLYSYSATYPQSYYRFIYYYLGYPINVLENTEALRLNDEYKNKKEVLKMKVFPAKNSIKMVDGVVVVKLS